MHDDEEIEEEVVVVDDPLLLTCKIKDAGHPSLEMIVDGSGRRVVIPEPLLTEELHEVVSETVDSTD